MKTAKEQIESGKAFLGIELGSTRIKACLLGEDLNEVLAVGFHDWENQFVDGLWTYSLDAIWGGLADCFASLKENVRLRHGAQINKLGALGVSAMMHGYLPFDRQGELLTPFRTWRNTNTGEAASQLTELFGINIPLRWSVAHLHQAVLEGDENVSKIDFLTTLAGYVHFKLSGEKVLGVGDASGMFPIDPVSKDYDARMLEAYQGLQEAKILAKPLVQLLPEVLPAGKAAGHLTYEGARLLDRSGSLQPGAIMSPPEGDAGTGMVATNAVAPGTGNISAGTSIFAMVVLKKPLMGAHSELDLVTTPSGDPVAMVHCNNGASELAAWVDMFIRFGEISGASLGRDQVYEALFQEALNGDKDAGGLLAYNYLAGEPITGLESGRPIFVRTPDSKFSLANAILAQLYGVFGTLSLGMEVLRNEGVTLHSMSAHGGIFRTEGVAQQVLAAAIGAPVTVSSGASEGGAWGMALLAAFAASESESLGEFLDQRVFAKRAASTIDPDPARVQAFADYLQRYRMGLAVVGQANQSLPFGPGS